MLTIILNSGAVRQWPTSTYTEYDIKGRFFVIIKDEQWIGMYAIDQIMSVELEY